MDTQKAVHEEDYTVAQNLGSSRIMNFRSQAWFICCSIFEDQEQETTNLLCETFSLW